jgi:hypothetical protein
MKLNQDEFGTIFQKAKARYPLLEHADINITFRKGWLFTMRAVIRLPSIFNKKRKYSINVNPRRENILSRLSEEDVTGWFGHELAHIIDYETMSGSKLVPFILRYLFNINFRFSVEKRINAYACNNGFSKELFGVWKKFLVMDGVSKRYQNYIIRNYSPYWEDIRETAEREGITEEVYKSFMQA